MARYLKTRLNVVSSDTSDYERPRIDESAEDTYTPDEVICYTIQVDTTDTTVELGQFNSISKMVVINEDTTNYVLAKYRTSKASKTFATNKLGFTASAPCTVTDDDSTFLTSLYAEAGDYAIITNATEAANSGTFFVQAAAAGTLTMAETVAFTLDENDVATPTIEMTAQCEDKLLAGESIVTGNVLPANDLVLIANTAACYVRVIVWGS